MQKQYWLVIVSADINCTGCIGCLMVPTEEEAESWCERRGELCDVLNLYMGEPAPVCLCVDMMSNEDYETQLGARYPLNNVVSFLE